MMIREVTPEEKEAFNKVAAHPLQSWEWGAFRQKTGNRVLRFGNFAGNLPAGRQEKLVEGYQLTVHRLPFTPFSLGVFLKGPPPNKATLSFFRDLAQKENLIFIRMEPNVAKMENARLPDGQGKWKMENLLRRYGAQPGRRLFTPNTFWLDLSRSEEELLAAMHPKTRYNIRLAERHGVTVSEDNSNEAFETYLRLLQETTKRQGFYAHSQRYHRLMWETLHLAMRGSGQAPLARLLTAKYKGEILVAWIVFVWHDFLYYPYGASSSQHREVMPSHAMMWEAMRFGKKLGLATFDLWGIEEGKGFTRFKEGFNPAPVEFLGTWDLVTNPRLYSLYRLAEEARWKILKAKTLFSPPSF